MKKERLVSDAALRLFAKKGLEKTSIDEIAAKAGVAKGTIYYHYRSKEEIFLRLIEETLSDLAEEIRTKIDPSESPQEKLEKLLTLQFSFFKKFKMPVRVLLSEYWELPKIWKEDRKNEQGFYSLVSSIITEGKQQGIFKKDLNTETLTTLIFGLITAEGIVNETLENQVPPKDIENTIKSVMLDGILS